MRKSGVALLLFIFVSIVSNSQVSIYYAAKYLRQEYSTVTKTIPFDDNTKAALSKFILKTPLDTASLNAEPFFEHLFEIASGSNASTFVSKGINALGGLDVTKYANAIADIMIERAKQELTLAFFNRFKKFSENNPEFKILFPKTTSNLENLLTYTYPQMIPALRNGFFEDLKQLTYNLDDVLELPRYRDLLKGYPAVTVAIRSIRLIHDLETGASTIADVLKDFAQFDEWKAAGSADFKNMGSTIMLASLFSESLRSEDTDRIWVSAKELKDLVKDKIFVRIFMGLLYQQIKNNDIKFYLDPKDLTKTTNLIDLIKARKEDLVVYQNKIAEFVNLADKVTVVYKEIKNKKDSIIEIANADVFNYINLSIDVADYALGLIKIFEQKLVTDKYLTIARKSNLLFKDIYSEQYTQAVNDAIDILTSVYDLSKNQPGAKPSELLEDLKKFVENVKPYALFMANMVEAKEEKEIKAALENVILPVGSSSIKKNAAGWGNISVQSYLGAYASLTENTGVNEGAWFDKFGVIAPIGISWTPGFLSWKQCGSLSLFASLFDLGAIVDYKLKKDSIPNSSGTATEVVVDKDYEVKFGQIFSPGGYLVYGFPWNLPLSLGAGAQYGPGLSKIEAGNFTVVTNPSWRWNVFLAVDIPFFTLKNKVKSKK